MPLDAAAVGRVDGPYRRTWDERDTILYALGVGAGQQDPLRELDLTTENTVGARLTALPTFAAVLLQFGIPDASLGEVDPAAVVAAEQVTTLHGPLPVAGQLDVTRELESIETKGSGALVTFGHTGVDPDTGRTLVTTRTSMFVRGEGGTDTPRLSPVLPAVPDSEPGRVLTLTVRADQALLYRLSGDRNPLHSDPAFAASAGFDRPILHGLCTYGTVARMVAAAEGIAPEDVRSVAARFTAPVTPGDTLGVRLWRDGAEVRFQVVHPDGRIALDRGVLTAATRSDAVPRPSPPADRNPRTTRTTRNGATGPCLKQ